MLAPAVGAGAAGREAISGERASSRRGPLRRRLDARVVGGVCAGIAEHLNVAPLPIRVIVALLAGAGGIGIALYALAWALIPANREVGGGAPSTLRRARGASSAALLSIVVLVVLRHAGFVAGDWLIWPLVLGACGMALVWRPTFDAGDAPVPPRREPLRAYLRRGRGRIDVPRVALGVLLVAFASAVVLHAARVLHSLGAAIGAVAIVATALGLLFGPWFVRLGRSLAFERAARIREQERAEVAAHLHDSVLQTLALIQKRSEDAHEVAALARKQERALRRWLFERPGSSEPSSLKAQLQAAAAEVEELHGVQVETVIVGDGEMDARLEAVVQAAREALTNAAKFAGAAQIDLYAEVGRGRVDVFVRDRGVGFDPEAIPADRRGVRESIMGRMVRHGGRSAIHSAPGEGTEVELTLDWTP